MQKCLKTITLPRQNKMHRQQQGEAIVWLSVDHTRTHTAGRVFLSHQLQKIICFTGKQEGETDRYSPGGWRSQRALFAQNCCDAPVRELGVSTGPPGTLCCRAGGQKENPQGLNKTDHVIEYDVTDSAQEETSGCRPCQSRGELIDA